jgi:hypothetical protein
MLSEQHRDQPRNRYSETMQNVDRMIERYAAKNGINLQGSSKAIDLLKNNKVTPSDLSRDEQKLERAYELIVSGKQDLTEVGKLLCLNINVLKSFVRKKKLKTFGGRLAAAYKEFKLLKTEPLEICKHYQVNFNDFQKYARKKRREESKLAQIKRKPSKYE